MIARKEKGGGCGNPRFTQHPQLLIIPQKRMTNINLAQFFGRLVFRTSESITPLLKKQPALQTQSAKSALFVLQ